MVQNKNLRRVGILVTCFGSRASYCSHSVAHFQLLFRTELGSPLPFVTFVTGQSRGSRKPWQATLIDYNELKGIQWNWQSLGRAFTTAWRRHWEYAVGLTQTAYHAIWSHCCTRVPIGH